MISSLVKKLESSEVISRFVFALFVIQPILDIISYFMILEGSTTITTLLRMVMLAIVLLYAFVVSDNKKIYFIIGGIMAVYWVIHVLVCARYGYISWTEDLAMYVRTVQMPLFTIAFIDLLKKMKEMSQVVPKAFWVNYIIITISIILSFAVNMPNYTYIGDIGIQGWFYTGNAQSCILVVMAALAICYAYRKKNYLLFAVTIAVIFANLYFFGTRVTFYSIFIIGICFLVLMIWNKEKSAGFYIILVSALAIVILCYQYSPCYLKESVADETTEKREEEIKDLEGSEEGGYAEFYGGYCSGLVERFGLEKVLEKFDYSWDAEVITNARTQKLNYSSLVMDEKDVWSKMFGFEYMEYIYDGEIYDPENDFPALYYSYGYVGVALYVLFVLYFAFKCIKQIIKELPGLQMEKALLGITIVLMLGVAQFSGNVLRRPNVSIYMSVMIAYLIILCYHSKKEKE